MNHHYIPRFYLQQWCNSENKVVYYSTPHKEVVSCPRGPDYICCQQDLYAREGTTNEAEKQKLETEIYKPIDDMAAKVISNILNCKKPQLTEKDSLGFATFLHSLGVRHIDQVERSCGHAAKILSNSENNTEIKHEETNKVTNKDFVIYTMEALSTPNNKLGLAGLSNFSNALQTLAWWKEDFSNTKFSLLTSDRPLTLLPIDENSIKYLQQVTRQNQNSLAEILYSKHFALYLPLSPTIGFFAAPTKLNWPNKTKLIKDLNFEITSRATRYVITQDKSQDKFIKKNLKHLIKNPF